MMPLHLNRVTSAAFAIICASAGTALADANNSFNLQPFKINLTSEISRTLDLVNNTRLPETALYPAGQQKGLQLDFLLSLRREWLTSFDWEVQQAELNGFRQFTAVIEGLKIHFVHERSQDPDAIPLVLLHGWGGSFHEFSPVIKPLTERSTANSAGRNVSYHVVVPSLPGFTFSSPPPENWTNSDSARIFNTLMTEVLGYSTYAVSGTDWGAAIAYDLYSSYNQTVRATHLALLIFLPPTAEEIAEQNITLSEDEQVTERRTAAYFAIGQGYFQEHEFKARPQLAWIGSKFKLWRDPQLAGTPPSVLNNTAILTSDFRLALLPHALLPLLRLDLRAECQPLAHRLHEGAYRCTAVVQPVQVQPSSVAGGICRKDREFGIL
ncbi:Epoxide hydrolase domain protein [Mycena venus]|uniref:Epoxide hydrolase domain protein n=1 Tax=Mycena venus TaxID=2733690 RepID=A0A8H7CNG4_9AGAR|nr:Epoxide hydrolase domain protein [Mycena venus]